MALHRRYAVTVSTAVATRSRADCSSMEGHSSLSTALVKFFRFFDDLTNCKTLFGSTASSSETSLFTAAAVVEVGLIRSKRIIANSFPGMESYAAMV